MTLVPSKEQKEHEQDTLRVISSMNQAHQAELEKLKRVIEKRGLRVIQMHMHYRRQQFELKLARIRIRALEEENVKLSRERDEAYEGIDDLHRGAAMNAEALKPQFPADMRGKPVTTPELYFNMDMSTAPRGGKLTVLNPGRIATFAVISERNRNDFIGWAPLPKIPKD